MRLETRQIQTWLGRWFMKNRPQEVKPFFMTQVLEDFQEYLEEQRQKENAPVDEQRSSGA